MSIGEGPSRTRGGEGESFLAPKRRRNQPDVFQTPPSVEQPAPKVPDTILEQKGGGESGKNFGGGESGNNRSGPADNAGPGTDPGGQRF